MTIKLQWISLIKKNICIFEYFGCLNGRKREATKYVYFWIRIQIMQLLCNLKNWDNCNLVSEPWSLKESWVDKSCCIVFMLRMTLLKYKFFCLVTIFIWREKVTQTVCHQNVFRYDLRSRILNFSNQTKTIIWYSSDWLIYFRVREQVHVQRFISCKIR